MTANKQVFLVVSLLIIGVFLPSIIAKLEALFVAIGMYIAFQFGP